MNKSENINEIAGALAKAQGEIDNAKKNSENPHFRKSYADLSAVWNSCRGPFAKHGLSIVQCPSTQGEFAVLTTMLMHTSGQWISETISVRPQKQDAQGIGSCLTYLRRYSLMGFAGVAPEGDDDDGNFASQPPQAYQPKQEYKPRPKVPEAPMEPIQAPASGNLPKPMDKPLTPEQKAANESKARMGLLTSLHAARAASQWSVDQLKEYCEKGFKVSSSKDLSNDQIRLIKSVMESTPFAVAIPEFENQPSFDSDFDSNFDNGIHLRT